MKILRRILAVSGIAAWAVLIVLTLISAFSGTGPLSDALPGLLFTDIALPVVLYAMQLMYRILKKK
ncbi:MAG: hypothetical protein LKG56_08805 [Lachnospiraceae bacterium]|nr:hypothetical protein [Lachnospiraceae bacterium]MCH4029900.1 hypothetical protein [Lachnospiraceae bacterium]MCH4109417.1 hypothetical protein [Lachnospiraceae bacterium]MCI1303035.1 hypothetical protein [Lachnospiraceae bacterium]MCI1332375.1 hypothetical protein [Lachnospiraceae bacterium]